MARTTATNFSGGLQFPYATAATDLFHKEDLQTLAQAVDQHDHSSGKGLATAIPTGSITLAKLAADSVDSSKIVDGSIATADLANGAVTSAKVSLSTGNAALASPVVLTASTFATAVGITLAAGTWLIWGGLLISNGLGSVVGIQARITDGAAVRASAGASLAASSSLSLGLPPALVTPASSTTYNLQGYSSGASGQVLATSQVSGEANATVITAVRIA